MFYQSYRLDNYTNSKETNRGVENGFRDYIGAGLGQGHRLH